MIIEYDKNYDDFIRSIFNYFNGRVNTFQKARLFINWCDLKSSANGALTTNPNCVTIYPKIIARFSNDINNLIINTFLIIIHELYHVDQNIIFGKLEIDPNYLKMIENTVEVQSASYLYNHLNEINKVFNLNIFLYDYSINNYINHYSDGNLYCRAKYIDHLLSMICDMTDYDFYKDISNKIREYFDNPLSLIDININGNNIIIKNRDFILNIDSLNEFMYNNYFYGDYNQQANADVYCNNDVLHINIKCNINCMVAVVK